MTHHNCCLYLPSILIPPASHHLEFRKVPLQRAWHALLTDTGNIAGLPCDVLELCMEDSLHHTVGGYLAEGV